MEDKKQKIISYIIIISSILFVAILGSIFVNIGMNWFNGLRKPSEFVPNILIPIVWTIIYSIFAVVLCLWVSKQELSKKMIVLLIVNGVLNILWCLIFFTLQQKLLGLVSIILLLIMAYVLVLEIKKTSKLYYYLTAIYPIWVSIATTLNLALWILN